MTDDHPLRVLIVDDEPLARDCVRLGLAGDPGVEIIGECSDGASAVQAIQRLVPEVVVLDVQMPEQDGFSVIEEVGADRMPVVVFVTAFDRYAVRAFELHALDYVLKPFDDGRLRTALRRARERLREQREGELGRRLADLLQARSHEGQLRRFSVRENDRIHFVPVEHVDWIEADGNYVVLHEGPRDHRLRGTIRALAARLDPGRFLQVHRSAIVNLDRVAEVQAWFGGDYLVLLRTGAKVKASRTYAGRLLEG